MLSYARPDVFTFPRIPTKFEPAVPITASTQLHELARGERVYLAFYLTKTGHSFLYLDPDQWSTNADFCRLKSFVDNFRVTNDVAERNCQLATDFRENVPKDPEQQNAYYVNISQQRRERSNLSRKALSTKWFTFILNQTFTKISLLQMKWIFS